MLSTAQIEERLRKHIALFLEREAIRSSPALIPLASLKRKGDPSRFYGGSSGPGTSKASPRAAVRAGGDGTQAGVLPKSVGGDGTKAGVIPKELSKTAMSPAKRDREPTQALPAKDGAGEKPSCPGGGVPRMVFGKWRCTRAPSKGAEKAKSRLAMKRKAKAKKSIGKIGRLKRLVMKAKKAVAQWFR